MYPYLLEEVKRRGRTGFEIEMYRIRMKKPKSKVLPFHWHREREILHVIKGKIRLTVEGDVFDLSEGDVVMISPNQVHGAFCVDKDNEVWYDALVYSNDFLKSGEEDWCTNQLYQKSIHFNRIISSEAIVAKLNRIDQLLKEDLFYNPFAVKGELFLLYEILLNNFVVKEQDKKMKHETFGEIKKVLSYIDKHYMEKITIDKLASLINRNRYTFMRMFKSIMYQTPFEYLKSIKITKACIYLISSDESISNISIACGFQSDSYFIKTFKEKRNLTPLAYRKRHQVN